MDRDSLHLSACHNVLSKLAAQTYGFNPYHPADDTGAFVPGPEMMHAQYDPGAAYALRSRVTKPAQRRRLEFNMAGGMGTGMGPGGSNTFLPHYAQPSDDISPEKARQMLRDGTAWGHPLTDAQKHMLGAVVGRGEHNARYSEYPRDAFGHPQGVMERISFPDFQGGRFGMRSNSDERDRTPYHTAVPYRNRWAAAVGCA